LIATRTPRSSSDPITATTWALSGNTLTINFPDGPLVLYGAAGGRIFVGSFSDATEGANGLTILVRTN